MSLTVGFQRSSPVVIGRWVQEASPETQRQIDALIRQDRDRSLWAEQVGPAYTQKDVAALLGVSRQAVSKRGDLLALVQSDGQVVYPVFQFDGGHQFEGVGEVVRTLTPAVATSWSIASWLTSPLDALEGRAPIDVLRDGDADSRSMVHVLARRAARNLSH